MIALQPFNKTGYARLISWVTSAEMLMQFAGPDLPFPLSQEQLDRSVADTNRIACTAWYIPDQQPIGHAEIYLPEAGTARLCRILIGDTAYRGQGLGLSLVLALLDLAFSRPGMEIVTLNVFDWNLPAIKCYENAGFNINKDQALTRHINGQAWTVLCMSLHQETQETIQKNTGMAYQPQS
ncbi:MAG: GNAT family protein [Bacteroidota bacterium]